MKEKTKENINLFFAAILCVSQFFFWTLSFFFGGQGEKYFAYGFGVSVCILLVYIALLILITLFSVAKKRIFKLINSFDDEEDYSNMGRVWEDILGMICIIILYPLFGFVALYVIVKVSWFLLFERNKEDEKEAKNDCISIKNKTDDSWRIRQAFDDYYRSHPYL